MSTIQIILTILVILILTRVFVRLYRKDINIREFLFWLIFWALALLVALWPDLTNKLAHKLDIGRGADMILYFSILGLVYAVFRIFVKIEKMERDISKVVQAKALQK